MTKNDNTNSGGSRAGKEWAAGLPVVSIITVVYNDVNGLERTLASISSQTYPNIEHVIIDGASTDGTLELIKKSEERISYWLSEPDKGLYDAMNKGIGAASGEFLWFMNAGDLINGANTTEQIFQDSDNPADIYYGDTMIVDEDYKEIGLRRLRPPENLTWKSFKKGMLVCHQAIIVRKSLADNYDPRYSHSADFDWVIKALKKADTINNTRIILASFLDGGHSKQHIKASLKERFHSMSKHYGFFPTLIRHLPIALRFFRFYSKEGRF